MNRRLFAVVFLSTIALVPVRSLSACGDKFLLGSRGSMIYRSAVNAGAAAILIYGRAAAAPSGIVINQDAAVVLRQEGYHASVAADGDALRDALRQRSWDLVLVNAPEASSVSSSLAGAAPPLVLPVLAKPTAAVLADARRAFRMVMRAPLKNQQFLDAVGDALDERFKERERAGKRH